MSPNSKLMFQRFKEKRLAAIRAGWGKVKDHYIPIDSVRIFFDQKPNRKGAPFIDDRIANDLDLDRVFEIIDRTNSRVGQQYLYDRLRRPENEPEALGQLEERIRHYGNNPSEREAVQLILSELNSNSDYYFPHLIFEELPQKPKWFGWVQLLQGISIGSLLMCIFYPAALWAFSAILPINLFIHYRNKNHVGKFLATFNRFGVLYRTGEQLIPYIQEDEQVVKHNFRKLKNILKKIGWINLERLQDQEIFALVWFMTEILKFITLSEFIIFYKLLDQIERNRDSVKFVFDAIGSLDTAISVASLRAGLPYFAKPEFILTPKSIDIKEALHPLLLDGVANDLQLDQKSMLLTGSNMSGKTTYIRTIGLNVILAQSILTPICQSYRAPFFHLGTSIRIKDDVEEDRSYYLEEVTVIGDLIKRSTAAEPYLFIIDEMFKGTNTLERVSAAKAVLSYLNNGNSTILISTHDIELTEYLNERFDLYYFQESVENSILTFDYRLKKGKLQQRNAIKILEIMNYPQIITDEAHQLASRIKIT